MIRQLLLTLLSLMVICCMSFGQNRFYAEGYTGITGDYDPYNYLGFLAGAEILPSFYVGIGGEFLNEYWSGDHYVMVQGQLRGYLDRQRRIYTGLTVGRGPQIMGRYQRDEEYFGRATKTELNLGIRLNPYLILAGGFTYLKAIFGSDYVFAGTPIYEVYHNDESYTLSGKVIFTLDSKAKWLGELSNTYGFLEWGMLNFMHNNWQESFGSFDAAMSAHVGGGIKVKEHLGLGIGFNASGISGEVGSESLTHIFHGVGLHAMGLWDSFHLMGEIGYAPSVEDVYSSTRTYRRFTPGVSVQSVRRMGRSPYLRLSMGPRIKQGLVIHLGIMSTFPILGVDVLSVYDPLNTPLPVVTERRKVIWGFQTGVGILVDN
ncbi:MAG: hypothetical protein AAFY71_04280 [Bacteroidota bacterium]